MRRRIPQLTLGIMCNVIATSLLVLPKGENKESSLQTIIQGHSVLICHIGMQALGEACQQAN